MYRWYFVLVLWLGLVGVAQGQTCRRIPLSDTLRLDSLTVLPESIRFPELETAPEFRLAPDGKTLLFSRPFSTDSALICYQTLALDLSSPLFRRSQAAYDSGVYSPQDSLGGQSTDFIYAQPREEIFASSGIRKSGSLSRGLSFGNRQDVFVNSNLNLQLEGEITEGLELSAIISDQNVPFQPEGNTQQLQEFDRVQVQLKHERFRLTAGDVLFQNQDDHFLRFYKNVTGALLEVNYPDSSGSAVGVSLAKGQFTSSFLEVKEGVQGPYRLRGPNNENFIIIIAGSERVFLDGKKLERGFNRDYTIDYNAAEITFTSNVLITQFSRVWVEFEFTAQNYSRTLWQARHTQRLGKWTLSAQHYQERDNRRNSLFRDLSPSEQALLISAGDDPVLAPTAQPVEEFSADRVLYRRRDTTVNGQRFSIFERTTEARDSLLSVDFSEVGAGNGNYVLDNSTANGRVYSWVAPQDGIPQGRYAPLATLPPPNQRQMSVFRTSYQLKEKQQFFAEIAISDQDQNLFSSEDDKNNQSYATWIGYRNEGTRHKRLLGLRDVVLESGASLEFVRQDFTAIDRFRPVEFDRDWSADLSQPADDWIGRANLGITKDAENFVLYDFSFRQRGEAVNGTQHKAAVQKRFEEFGIQGDFFRMNNEQLANTSDWNRWTTEGFWRSPDVQAGYIWSGDQNRVFRTENDSVTQSAMFFEAHEVYLRQGDSSRAQFRLSYQFRTDQLPREGEMQAGSEAHTATLSGRIPSQTNALEWNITYRDFQAKDSLLSDEETLQGRLDWRGNWLDKHIRSNLTFTTATGQEPRREFVFLPVETGLGTHTWRDENGDGVQDLNEFYEAINPDERNYVKIWRPTQEFQSAYTSSISYQLNLRTPRKWQKAKGFTKLLGQLSGVFAWQSSVRATNTRGRNRFASLWQEGDAEELLSREEILRGSLFLNRAGVRYGAQLSYQTSGRKDLLTNGFESKAQDRWQLLLRKQLATDYTLQLGLERSDKSLRSDFLGNRNYQIRQYALKPELAWQPSPRFRIGGSYRFEDKQNRLLSESDEQATLHEATLSLRQMSASERNLQAEFRWLDIRYNAAPNNALGYEMLEALQPGTNYTWQLDWQQKVLNGLRLTLSYQGRKSEGQSVVHIGRMQVTALF